MIFLAMTLQIPSNDAGETFKNKSKSLNKHQQTLG